MPLNEHVYCVAVTVKMTVEQLICIKFCIKLEHFSTETIPMIQKAAAMGQLVMGSFITTGLIMQHAWCRFSSEASNHPGDSGPLQPRFGTPRLLALTKTKITFEMEDILDH